MLRIESTRELYILGVLKEAQRTYGHSNQIMVAIEELCELSSALSNPESSKSDILDEIADAYVILEHVKMIFGLSNSLYFKIDEASIHEKIGVFKK